MTVMTGRTLLIHSSISLMGRSTKVAASLDFNGFWDRQRIFNA
jgi:hypothetical protein